MNLYEDKFRFLNYNLKKYNWRLLLLVMAATTLGLFVIESAADGYARKQLLGMIVGLIALVIVSFIDYFKIPVADLPYGCCDAYGCFTFRGQCQWRQAMVFTWFLWHTSTK